jgi:hypothetical protein
MLLLRICTIARTLPVPAFTGQVFKNIALDRRHSPAGRKNLEQIDTLFPTQEPTTMVKKAVCEPVMLVIPMDYPSGKFLFTNSSRNVTG